MAPAIIVGSYTLAGGRISKDDDVQFLYENAPYVPWFTRIGGILDLKVNVHVFREPYLCEMCQIDISRQSTDERQTHYERHFSDEAQGTSDTQITVLCAGWLSQSFLQVQLSAFLILE
jgi:hypothetical protein